MSVEVAAPPEETRPEVSAVNEEEEEDCIDFTALTEAQHAGADAAERRKRRAGTKESAKRRKRQKRENDILCVKQAGIALPSLHDVLKGNRKAIVIPSLKEALRQNATDQESAPLAATPAPAASPVMSQSAGEASSGSRPVNRGVCYDDLEDDPLEAAEDGSKAGNEKVEQTEAALQVDQERLAVALKRVTKDSQRRVKAAQAANARSVFITNLPFKAKEDEIRDWLGPAGDIKGLRLNRDKATTKALGYGHVQFASPEAAENAVKQCDKIELHGRVMRVAPISDEKFQFELPEEIKEDLRNLLKEAYEGKNISTIKDAWQKRHPGQKLNTTKWGFKNFSTALKTLEGVTLEHHLEKTLTFLAFFDGSSKHKEFLEAKAKKASLGPATLTPGEAKRAAAEADPVPKAQNGSS